MSDVFDQASDREQADRDLALQGRKPEGPRATGECLWCDEPVEDGRRWCGAECREKWEAKARQAVMAS